MTTPKIKEEKKHKCTNCGGSGIVDWHTEEMWSWIEQNYISREDIGNKIGALRQWLNEDRIGRNRMVTNEELRYWLLDEPIKDKKKINDKLGDSFIEFMESQGATFIDSTPKK